MMHPEYAARIGYAAKGVVYASVGALAAMAAFGPGGSGEVGGTRNAIEEIAQRPFGTSMMAVLAIGLVGYVGWRMTQAIADTEDKGRDLGGVAQRIGLAISGLTYAALALYTARLAGWFGGGSGSGSGGGDKRRLVGTLMQSGWGRGVLVGFGLVLVGVGLYQGWRSIQRTFEEHWRLEGMGARARDAAVKAAQVGIMARAVTFVVMGGLVVHGALTADPSKVKGLGQVLATMGEQPFGRFLLGAVAVGVVLYGVYCFLNARFRVIDGPDDGDARAAHGKGVSAT